MGGKPFCPWGEGGVLSLWFVLGLESKFLMRLMTMKRRWNIPGTEWQERQSWEGGGEAGVANSFLLFTHNDVLFVVAPHPPALALYALPTYKYNQIFFR